MRTLSLMAGRQCSTCGARHQINARRCKKCGAVFRVTGAWEVATGQPPSRAQVDVLRQHPKFDQLLMFDNDRLTASAREAVVDDAIDVDAWVAAAVHRALAGPPRPPAAQDFVATLPEHPVDHGPGTGNRPEPRDTRLMLILGLAVVLVFVFVLVLYNG